MDITWLRWKTINNYEYSIYSHFLSILHLHRMGHKKLKKKKVKWQTSCVFLTITVNFRPSFYTHFMEEKNDQSAV